MKRLGPPLLSMLVALSALAFGSSYAAFTASDTETGSVAAAAAGTAEIRLNTLTDATPSGAFELVWDDVTCPDSGNMAPGFDHRCQATISVYNDGSLMLYYTITDLESLPCFDVAHEPPIDNRDGGDGIGAANTFKLPPMTPGFDGVGTREVESIRASVTLSGANECQGASGFTGLRVDASTTP
jgi:hypothetical protein